MIFSPFLVPTQNNDQTTNSTELHNEATYSSDCLRIQTAYQIISICMVCVSVLFFYIYARHRHTLAHPSRMASSDCYFNNHRFSPKVYKIVIILATAFMSIYYGLEIAMADFITTFAYVSEIKLSKATGATITSVYWSTYATFQLFTAFYIKFVGAERNIIFLLTTVMIANCFLIPFASTHAWCLWTGSAIIGMGMSALWGSIYGYLESYFPVVSTKCFFCNSTFSMTDLF